MILKTMLFSTIILTGFNATAQSFNTNDILERNKKRFELTYTKQENNLLSNSLNKYVINGTNANISDFPYYARLVIPNGEDSFFHTCGGSILNQRYILTAAHCVENVDISNYAIVINKGTNEFSVSDYKYIEEVFIHPEYNTVSAVNDIAILKLNDDIQEKYTPITIPSINEVNYYNSLKEFVVVGMGQTNTNNEVPEFPDTLQKGTVSFLSDSDCSNIITLDGNNTLCANTNAGTDSCYGDSGGPITYLSNGTYRQAGLVSFGLGTEECATEGGLTVYTELSGYSDFIKEISSVERDVVGVNDTEKLTFLSQDKSSGGSLGIFGLFFLISTLISKKTMVSKQK